MRSTTRSAFVSICGGIVATMFVPGFRKVCGWLTGSESGMLSACAGVRSIGGPLGFFHSLPR